MLGKEHPGTLVSVNNLAGLINWKGAFARPSHCLVEFSRPASACSAKSIPIHSRAWTIWRRSITRKGFSEAEALFRRALEARERMLGKEHPDTLGCVLNLAILYNSQGRFGDAWPFFRRFIDGSERTLGKEHPNTLGGVNGLAAAYDSQGFSSEAEPLFERVLEARARLLGNEHPNTLETISNLAALYFKQSDWSRAVQFWRRATTGIAWNSCVRSKPLA